MFFESSHTLWLSHVAHKHIDCVIDQSIIQYSLYTAPKGRRMFCSFHSSVFHTFFFFFWYSQACMSNPKNSKTSHAHMHIAKQISIYKHNNKPIPNTKKERDRVWIKVLKNKKCPIIKLKPKGAKLSWGIPKSPSKGAAQKA